MTVTNLNEAGTITGPTDVDYAENGAGTVATYSVADPEGDAVTWSVGGTDAARFSIDSDGALTFDTPPDYEAPRDANKDGVYEVTVTASDGNLSVSLDVEVTVTDVNEAGTITGPTAVDYPENEAGAVATYTAADPEGDAVTWSVSGTDAARFSISIAGVLTFDASPDYEVPRDANKDTTYEVTVTASDGNLSASLDVEVTVTNVNESGVITGPADVDYAENGTGAVATYTAADPEGDAITWSVGGADAVRFGIDSDGALTFDTPPDYEAPRDANKDGVYEITVTATDGNLSASLDVEVTVTDVNEAGMITGPVAVDYAENGAGAVATYTAADPEGDSITWSISGTDAARFSISSDGALTFDTPPDYEAPRDANKNGIYEITVTATDGNLSASLDVAVTITNVNESGAITGPTDVDYAENSTDSVATYTATDPEDDSITWAVSGTDAARFSINSAGVLTFDAPPDYEVPRDANKDKVYEVTVTASDGNLSASLDVEVTITNVNEAGTITGPIDVDYAENSSGAVATYTATDPEGDAVAWSVSGVDGHLFTIDQSGALSFLDSPNFEAPHDANGDNTYVVQLSTSQDGELSQTLDIVIHVTDANDAPQFPSRQITASIPENSCPGAHAILRGISGGDGAERDEDGDPLTFVLGGPDAGAFVIHPPSGHVTLGPGVPLDFEGGRGVFTLSVSVSDGRDGQGAREDRFVEDDRVELIAVVADVDEPPVFIGASLRRDACGRPLGYDPAQLHRTATVTAGATGGSSIDDPVAAVDPEGKPVTYAIAAQLPPGTFSIDAATGQIRLGPGFSAAGARSAHTLRVTASDGGNESAIEVGITVDVEPEAEPQSESDSPSGQSAGQHASYGAPGAQTPPPAQESVLEQVSLSPEQQQQTAPPRLAARQIVFIPVDHAAQVPEFGRAEAQDAGGRARLAAPAGALASAYQVRLTEVQPVCAEETAERTDIALCVCISVELFDVSGAPIPEGRFNRAATLDFPVDSSAVSGFEGDIDIWREARNGAVEIDWRPGPEHEWTPARLTVRTLDDGTAILTTSVRHPGQYRAVIRRIAPQSRSNEPAAPPQVLDMRNSLDGSAIATPAQSATIRQELPTIPEAPFPEGNRGLRIDAEPLSPASAQSIGRLVIALLLDVAVVMAAAAILHRLTFSRA